MLTRKCEPGEIGEHGKFVGKPLPHGGAFVEPSADIDPSRRIAWLVEAAAAHLNTFREVGATNCKFHLDVLYRDQCNLCFASEELASIAALGINFTITCYSLKRT